jgi:hypothetical protein
VKDLESTMNTDKKHSGTINLLDRPTSDEIVSGYKIHFYRLAKQA